MQPTEVILAEVKEEVTQYGYGWKFLTPFVTTETDHGSFEYNIPQRGQKWSDWTYHPDPCPTFDPHSDCGTGRLHIMNKLNAEYANKSAMRCGLTTVKCDLCTFVVRRQKSGRVTLSRLTKRQSTVPSVSSGRGNSRKCDVLANEAKNEEANVCASAPSSAVKCR